MAATKPRPRPSKRTLSGGLLARLREVLAAIECDNALALETGLVPADMKKLLHDAERFGRRPRGECVEMEWKILRVVRRALRQDKTWRKS